MITVQDDLVANVAEAFDALLRGVTVSVDHVCVGHVCHRFFLHIYPCSRTCVTSARTGARDGS
ncbi:MAG TPA: hypothetical protein VL485_16240 [Ktedonobacteraceae bacterium]|nr:hypothetical protein [Ktedonobacteraceae bacterium]